MILTLTWKELREHRSIWVTMIVMTWLLGLAVVNLTSSAANPGGTLGITMLALAGVYGVVCGSMMFAGEREGGTLVLFDIFLGRRWRLWLGKVGIGAVFAATEGIAVATILALQQQTPPEWAASLIGYPSRNEWFAARTLRPTVVWWFVLMPMVTVEAYAWGLLASSFTQRVLTSAGLALLMGFHAWMLLAFLPQPASLVLRTVALLVVLGMSFNFFTNQGREMAQILPPAPVESPRARVLRELALEMHEDRRLSKVVWDDDGFVPTVIPLEEPPARPPPRRTSRPTAWDEERSVPPTVLPAPGVGLPVVAPVSPAAASPTESTPPVVTPAPLGAILVPLDAPSAPHPPTPAPFPPRAGSHPVPPSTDGEHAQRTRRPRHWAGPPEATSPRQVLLWLTFRQATLTLACLAAACVVAGAFMPNSGQTLWPIATLLLGVGCGVAAFAWEQSDLSYQFLAAQHIPLRTVWNVKVLVWAIAALLGILLLFLGGLVVLIFMSAAPRPGGGALQGFEFGALLDLLGPVNYVGIWLAYGFGVGQLFVLLCKKPVYAVIVAVMVSAGALSLWLPGLLCRGTNGWQAWVAPIVLLAATRILMRAWAAGRIKERRPMAALIGLGVAAVAWAAVNYGYRAWSVPDVGDPVDRTAFRAALPGGEANDAAKKIQEALAEFEITDGKQDVWRARLAEIRHLPPGVIEAPSAEGQTSFGRHVPVVQKLAGKLIDEAKWERNPEPAFDRVAEVLALSRNLRNKAGVTSYLAGIDLERAALERLEDALSSQSPPAVVLEKMHAELGRHAAQTPPALDCLQTECYRAGGLLRNPTSWGFYSGTTRVSEQWLAGGIALSLDLPWEDARKCRIWRAVWAGQFRALQKPHWELAQPTEQVPSASQATRRALRDWLPANDGAGAGLSAAQLAIFLDASWLSDERLFVPAGPLRLAATRAQCRIDMTRLAVALALYQAREGKSAQQVADLAPRYFAELPIDPYSGQAYQYRVSKGEQINVAREGPGPENDVVQVRPGDCILWSTGPDSKDDGGRRSGSRLQVRDRPFVGGQLDLIIVVRKGS